ncbi:hypothetical protein LTR94_024967 [Friedmanniomyces endolithicus]|nr:hypothetical protein LTR94_024967 [Friedmanniomyces endolithicus]
MGREWTPTTLSERAAWDFMASEGGEMELTALLPVAVMGPVMGGDVSGTNRLIQRMLSGEMRGLPDLYIPIVDVRDVATAHVQALTSPKAAGERLLLSSGPALSLKEISRILKSELGARASKVSARRLPSAVIRLLALFNPELRHIAPDLGYAKKLSNAKARRLLDWTPRRSEEAVVSAAMGLLEN